MNVPPTKESGKVSMESFSMLNERYSNALVTIREVQAERDALREAGNAVVASGSDRTSMWVSVRVEPFDALVAALDRPE